MVHFELESISQANRQLKKVIAKQLRRRSSYTRAPDHSSTGDRPIVRQKEYMKSYWDPLYKTSLAFSRFINDHTQNNEFYWHVVLTRMLACKYSAGINPDDVIAKSPIIVHKESFRFPHQFKDWKKRISDKENWIRLNALLASTSYLEQYIYEITLLAISNDPGVLLGKSRTVNGVHFLKNNYKINGLNTVDNFTKGTWPSRYKQLKKYFVFFSEIDEQKINALEKIRIIRNKIAHRFGRDFVTDMAHFTRQSEVSVRLSENKLKEYLGIIKDTAEIIDLNLYKNHVVNFEIILYWHNWDKFEKHTSWNNWTIDRKLRYSLTRHVSNIYINTTHVGNIIKYYNEA